MALPQIVVTGSSGFLGRHLLDELKEKYRIFGIARRTPAKVGAARLRARHDRVTRTS